MFVYDVCAHQGAVSSRALLAKKKEAWLLGGQATSPPAPLPIAQTQLSLCLEQAELQKKEGGGWFSSPAADMDYGPEVTASGCPHF